MASPASTDLTLTVKAELCAYAHTSRHDCWAVASIKAPLFEPETRVPIDVVAVIDESDSMAGEKLELAKKALLFVIGQLKEWDRFSLVTYSDDYSKLGLIKMTKENKAKASSAVEAIRDLNGSGTNLCQGLLKGMEEIANNGDPEKAKIQSVLLLTDGVPCIGVRSIDGILTKMMQIQNPQGEKFPQKNFDGTVCTFGFGDDHDAGLLTAISTQGRGAYYYIDTNEKIPEYFAKCLDGLQRVVGQNLSLKLEIQGDNQLNEVYVSGTVNRTTPNKSCEISLGDIQSEEGRDIVMSLILPALAASTTESVLKATLSYFNVISSSIQTISCDLVVSRTDTAPSAPDPVLDQQRNHVATLKQAKALADEGRFEDAVTLLYETLNSIEQSASAQSDMSKALLVDLSKSLWKWDQDERIPSSVSDVEWIYTFPYNDAIRDKETFGKWLVFRSDAQLDETWQLIKEHVRNGYLGATAADTSTMLKSKTCLFGDGVVCVFTTKEDIDQVGLKLIRLVGDKILRYKTDAATSRNVYRMYGAPKTIYKSLRWNNGNPQFWFDKRYGNWYIRCARHENFDSMLQSIQQASEDGMLGDINSVRFFTPRTDNVRVISVCTTEEDIENVGRSIIQIVRRDIHYKATNMCAGMRKKALLRWNKGSPIFTCEEFL